MRQLGARFDAHRGAKSRIPTPTPTHGLVSSDWREIVDSGAVQKAHRAEHYHCETAGVSPESKDAAIALSELAATASPCNSEFCSN